MKAFDTRRRSAATSTDRVRGPVARRAAGVFSGGVLVGALVLGATTASGHSTALVPVETIDAPPAAVVEMVAAAPAVLDGFTPPEPRPEPAVAPQFRIAADLPSGPLGIPGVVLKAYKLAADRVGAESPQCKLPWFLLAGIGRIESNHASNGSVDEFGTTINTIAGPVLDGSLAGNAVITDTDGGAIDGDPKFDRAMGPMQFIPSTWSAWGSDANGDGKADPNNIFDATYSAGRYLCAGVSDIMAEPNKVSAVLRYNRSMEYVGNVLGWAGAYATGVMPTDPIPEMKRPPSSSSESPSTTPESEAPESAESSTPPSSAPNKPREHCIAPGVCIPIIEIPGLPGQPAPKQQAPKQQAPDTVPSAAPAR